MGYNIFMPKSALEIIKSGEEIRIHTYMSVREDAVQLYGFLSRDELEIFKKLIAVSGVGPKGGLAIISTLPGDSLTMAIISSDAKAISKAPGIGSKTASKIIIELRDKIDVEEMLTGSGDSDIISDSSVKNDAIEALVTLGYSQTAAVNAIKKIDISPDMDVEELLKLALKNII
jgi:Holliday junction DNA helicase RuvA